MFAQVVRPSRRFIPQGLVSNSRSEIIWLFQMSYEMYILYLSTLSWYYIFEIYVVVFIKGKPKDKKRSLNQLHL